MRRSHPIAATLIAAALAAFTLGACEDDSDGDTTGTTVTGGVTEVPDPGGAIPTKPPPVSKEIAKCIERAGDDIAAIQACARQTLPDESP